MLRLARPFLSLLKLESSWKQPDVPGNYLYNIISFDVNEGALRSSCEMQTDLAPSWIRSP